MDRPIFDHLVQLNRFETTRPNQTDPSSVDSGASFANLFRSRDDQVAATKPDHEADEPTREESVEDETTVEEPAVPPQPTAGPDQPAKEPSSIAAPIGPSTNDSDERTKGEQTTEHSETVDIQLQAEQEIEALPTRDPTTQMSVDATPAVVTPTAEQPTTAPIASETAQAHTGEPAPQNATTETSTSVDIAHAAPSALLPPDAGLVSPETATDEVQPKERQKRTNSKADKGNKSTQGTAKSQGNHALQALAGRAADGGTVGEPPGTEVEPVVERQSAASNLAGEHTTENTDSTTSTDPNSRTAATERMAEHLLTRSTSRTDGSRELSQVDQTRVIQRVARAIHAAPQQGGVIRLRLRPPELGSLHLEVTMEKGGLTARLETETQTARNVLLENLPQLRERLEGQGIRIEQFDIDVSQQDAGQSHQQTDQPHESGEFPGAETGDLSHEEPADDPEPSAMSARTINQKNLNVVI